MALSKLFRVYGLLAVFLLCAHPVCSEEIVFQPARFKGNFDVFDDIEVPSVGVDGEVRIYCLSHISERGKIDRVFCRSDTLGVDDLLGDVASAARKLRFHPVRVDGKIKEVRFQFSIVAKSSISGGEFSVFPHVFLNYKKYGLEYSAPQIYDYPDLGLWWYQCKRSGDLLLWVEVLVDELGVAHSPRIYDGVGPGGNCFEALKKYSVSAKYIPAFEGDKAVSARYITPHFTWNSW